MDIGAYREKETITSDFLDVAFILMHFCRDLRVSDFK